MADMVRVPRADLYKSLEEQGLIMTEMRDEANTVWYNKKDGQHYLVPDHESYPPSIINDLLNHILGERPKENLQLIDSLVFKVTQQL